MPRVALLLPKHTYRSDFVEAAESLGAEIVIASDFRQAMSASMDGRDVLMDFADPDRCADVLAELHARTPLDAVVATDEQGVVVAAVASQRLGFPANDERSARTTRDKWLLRNALDGAVAQPGFALVARGAPAAEGRAAVEAVGGYPVVLKPLSLSASQGVIRVDGDEHLDATLERVRRIACDDEGPVLVEGYVPGFEVAVEALLRDGALEVLAVFDKPDPLVGPYFEETIYVTPSRLPSLTLQALEEVVANASAAIGLRHGPVHAEVRIDDTSGVPELSVIEVAGRSIGGLCSRTLRFGLGVSLEQIIVRHALGLPLPRLRRERAASGVMMLPIPCAGVLDRVDGVDEALAVPGVDGVEITLHPGSKVVPLPEGDRYLGFLFARGSSASEVEVALRAGAAALRIRWR